MYSNENIDSSPKQNSTTGIPEQPEPSGWSAIPTKKLSEQADDQKQDAEQKVYANSDSQPPNQETGGPDKPTA